MQRYRRTRKACNMDKQHRIAEMAERSPSASAAKQFIHKAFQSYTVDEYMKNRGKKEIGNG